MNKKRLVLAAVAAALSIVAWQVLKPGPTGSAHVSVQVPELSKTAQSGAKLFASKCVRCHGENAAGSDNGPPLIHKIYEPNHHGDASFQAAVRVGVRPHHWRYEPMPPIPGVSPRAVARITAYVRELQRANGIY